MILFTIAPSVFITKLFNLWLLLLLWLKKKHI